MIPLLPAYTSPDLNSVRISRRCRITGEYFVIDLKYRDYKRWKHEGELIQDVFPEMEPDIREILISGYTPAEFKEIFS